MRKIALVACSSKKRPYRSKAEDLYISPLFKLSLEYAIKLQPHDIFILSANHGLLPLEKEIEPYNLTLNRMHTVEVRRWAAMVLGQIRRICEIDETEFIFFAGKRYRKYLIPHLTFYKIPLEGLGIGQQLKALKSKIGE